MSTPMPRPAMADLDHNAEYATVRLRDVILPNRYVRMKDEIWPFY